MSCIIVPQMTAGDKKKKKTSENCTPSRAYARKLSVTRKLKAASRAEWHLNLLFSLFDRILKNSLFIFLPIFLQSFIPIYINLIYPFIREQIKGEIVIKQNLTMLVKFVYHRYYKKKKRKILDDSRMQRCWFRERHRPSREGAIRVSTSTWPDNLSSRGNTLRR